MQISQFLDISRCRSQVSGRSKKRVLELVAELASQDAPGLAAEALFDGLLERERLGSTGLGNGIAIPHCRIDNCTRVTGVLLTLDDGVDFEAVDDEPVKLVFAIVVPNEDSSTHLEVLATLAETLSDEAQHRRLLECTSDGELYQVATGQTA